MLANNVCRSWIVNSTNLVSHVLDQMAGVTLRFVIHNVDGWICFGVDGAVIQRIVATFNKKNSVRRLSSELVPH